MPDVSLIRFDRPYVADDTVPIRRASAFAWIKHALSMTELIEPHLKEMIKIGVWKWTGAAGVRPYPTHNLRFISEGVLHPSGPAKINHEHVWTQKSLFKTLRSRSWTDDSLRAVLEECAVACVVTVDEHARLSGQTVEGWERYVKAGVRVWDRSTQDWADIGGPGTPVETPLPPPVTMQREGVPISIEVDALIAEKSTPALAALLRDFIAAARHADAVETPSYKKTGEPSRYFRVHDAMVGEPTAAVAYPHWNGRVTYRLQMDDLPANLIKGGQVQPREHAKYGVKLKITDSSSLELACAVLEVALVKVREPYEI